MKILSFMNKPDDIELQNPNSGIAEIVPADPPTPRTPFSTHVKNFLPKIRLPVALIVGAGITGGTTYALVKHVQHIIATASVSSDPAVWDKKARTDGYGACYDGCDDCHDINLSYNACQKTARATVRGIDCNGTKMWNWADRYPIECIKALGEIYKSEALARKKETYRHQLAVIILTVLAGVIGAVVAGFFWKRWFPKSSPSQAGWPAPPPYKEAVVKTRRRRTRRWPLFWRTATAATVIGGTHAFPCWGKSKSASQYFINSNNTISGVVHGWTSNCYWFSYVCGETCSGGSSGPNGNSGQTCTTDWCQIAEEDVKPIYYVNNTLTKVQGCGFRLVDSVEGEVKTRIGNPLLERNWRVKISVNRFNLTEVTDPSVLCLWDIGNH